MGKSLLPHFYQGHSTFFITFRLADSLPQSELIELKEKFQAEKISITELDEIKRKEILDELTLKYFRNFEHQLHQKLYGDCVLKHANVAQILYDKILSYDELHYNVKCFSVMPNHVHILFTSIQNEDKPQVDKWMQFIKGGSAYLINKALKRSEKLWAPESFDKYIRNDEHYRNSFNYTINNPISAGLSSKYSEKPYMYRCDGGEG